MHALLIVDDEIPSRELIKMSLNWREHGFAPVLEARNGRDALALWQAHRPYLVITDIQMPVMDGLALIRQIRAQDPDQRIVVLSCHECFSYAKEALKLGVLDYLIKDQMTEESLINMLSTVGKKAPEPREGPPARDACFGALRAALAGKENRAAWLAPGMSYFLCGARFNMGMLAWTAQRALESAIEGVLDKMDAGEVCAMQDALYMLVLLPKCAGMAEAFERRAACLAQLRTVLEGQLGAQAIVGVSRIKEKACDVGGACDEVRCAMKSFVFLGKGRNLYYEDAYRQTSPDQLALLDQSLDQVKDALGARDKARVLEAVCKLYRQDLCGMRQYNYVQHVSCVLLGILTEGCKAGGIPFERIFSTEIISMEMLSGLDSIEEIGDWYLTRFGALCDLVCETHSPKLAGVVDYLREHFTEDIGLERVAHTFRMHKAYLAKIFKAQLGVSVNEYIRDLRMARAKALLGEDDARVGEVAQTLGFNNPQTFYNLFKRETGMSPSEYKESCDMKRVRQETIAHH
ncbi:MAG: response regulator [Clostridia bacterium]